MGDDSVYEPDYIGIVSGAQYKLEAGDGVFEYALVMSVGDDAYHFAASHEDLRVLGKQISGLMGE